MRNPLTCSSCKTKLMEETGYYKGETNICLNFGASVLANIDKTRHMRLSIELLIEKPQQISVN